MEHLSKFREDDENDTLTFEGWQEYVVEHYPNPGRIGCPDHEVLRKFVDTPAQVGLDELNDTHITRCRECALELQTLRHKREVRLAALIASRSRLWGKHWVAVASVFAMGALIVVGIVFWKGHVPTLTPPMDDIAHVDIDLSRAGLVRGDSSSLSNVHISLPRRAIDLHLTLPYLSPTGVYRITVQHDRNSRALVNLETTTQASGFHTAVRVRLDLRDLPTGHYLISTTHDGEITYFYPLTIN